MPVQLCIALIWISNVFFNLLNCIEIYMRPIIYKWARQYLIGEFVRDRSRAALRRDLCEFQVYLLGLNRRSFVFAYARDTHVPIIDLWFLFIFDKNETMSICGWRTQSILFSRRNLSCLNIVIRVQKSIQPVICTYSSNKKWVNSICNILLRVLYSANRKSLTVSCI